MFGFFYSLKYFFSKENTGGLLLADNYIKKKKAGIKALGGKINKITKTQH